MLTQLSIRNFALISGAELVFHPGFTAITGETGSGKSILLGALNLILGERADYSVIRDPEKKTVVEAVFRLDPSLKDWFEEEDIDWESETVLRREIAAQGKSRAFINDTPVQLTQLKALTEQLIYIHSQHQTLELKKSQFQLDLVDAFSGCSEEAQSYRGRYRSYRTLLARLDQLKRSVADQVQESDYLRFQLDELESMELSRHDFAAYEHELQRMDSLDDLRTAFEALSEGMIQEQSALDSLRMIKQIVDKSRNADPVLESLGERLNATLIELNDIAAEAGAQLESLEANPERQRLLLELLDKYNHLLRKHQLTGQAELIELERALQERFSDTSSQEEEIAALSVETAALHSELKTAADQLHQKRVTGSLALSKHLIQLLEELKLPGVRLQFEWSKEEPDMNAGSSVQLLFSANAGLDPKPIDKTASGGELSRLMLAVQATLSEKKALPTLILDEIDTGVSGEVALRIGKLLHEMGTHMQLFAITHLPQVAAKGQHQYEVSKKESAGETNTTILALSAEERLDAIARLMSGDRISEASRANAQLLMS